MLIELNDDEFSKVESFFKGPLHYIPALSVLHGHFPGRVFVDDVDQPTFALVWAVSRWVYIEGKAPAAKQGENVVRFLEELFQKEEPEKHWFEIYTREDPDWEAVFHLGPVNHNVMKHYESVYVLNIKTFQDSVNRRCTKGIMNSSDGSCKIEEFPILPMEYRKKDDIERKFLDKTCFGARLSIDKQTIAICKNNGFELDNMYFVDVDTLDTQHRGKGYATEVSFRLIQYGLERGHLPLWETTHENVASHKLATKLGFERHHSYPVYTFIEKNIYDKISF